MKSIYIVEDNENNRMLFEDIFRKHLHLYSLRFFSDGLQLLEVLKQEHPDIILLDMRLPHLSGWDIAKTIKHNPILEKIPIIAVTAHAMKGDETRALEAGCSEFVTKPIKKQILLDNVGALLANS